MEDAPEPWVTTLFLNAGHPLITTLLLPEFRSLLMSMLRPMDIIRLVFATGIRITPAERSKYMTMWRQICLDMRWVSVLNEKDCKVTIVGNGLRKLNSALRRGDHTLDIDQLHYIVVVGGTSEGRPLEHELQITDYFDTTVQWHDIRAPLLPVFNAEKMPPNIQASIFSLARNSWISFDESWAEVLYERRKMSLDPLGSPLRHVFDVLETEFYELGNEIDATFNPKSMHYIVQPWKLDKYATRVFITPQRSCLAILMKKKL